MALTSRGVRGLVLGLSVSGIAAMAIGACASGQGVDGQGGAGGSGGDPSTTQATSVTHGATTNATSTKASSTAVGNTTTGASMTTTVSSTSGGPMCTDPGPGESNNTMATAFDMGTITDADGDGKTVSGMLDQTGMDVDWYVYHGDDVSFSIVDPSRQLLGGNMRICKYLSCSGASVDCPSGTTADNQGGKQGCCWTGGAAVTVGLDCSGGDDDADVFIRIDHPGGLGCEAYQFSYHY